MVTAYCNTYSYDTLYQKLERIVDVRSDRMKHDLQQAFSSVFELSSDPAITMLDILTDSRLPSPPRLLALQHLCNYRISRTDIGIYACLICLNADDERFVCQALDGLLYFNYMPSMYELERLYAHPGPQVASRAFRLIAFEDARSGNFQRALDALEESPIWQVRRAAVEFFYQMGVYAEPGMMLPEMLIDEDHPAVREVMRMAMQDAR